jgi:hypothetical protein
MSERDTVAPEAVEPAPARDPIAAPQPQATAAAQLLALQRTVGNRAASRMVAEGRIDRRPTQVRESWTERRTGTLGVYAGSTAFEIDFGSLEATLTVKIRLVPDRGIAADVVDHVKADTIANFERLWDNQFILTDDRSHEQYFLRARLVFVDHGGHLRVRLRPGDGPTDQTTWYADDAGISFAHEASHTLGLRDEYVDPTSVPRRTATSPGVFQDHSVMGNYWNEGIDVAEVKLRHGQALARSIGRATHRRFSASFSGPALGDRIVRWRGIRDGLAAGTPERAAAAAEVEAREREMGLPELGAAVGEPYVPTP